MQLNACATRKLLGNMDRPEDKPERNALPRELLSVLWPALQLGSVSGISGLLFGGVAGILRSSTPTLFAIASGIQWFTLGSTYWAARGIMLNVWERDMIKPSDAIATSSIAGGIAGCAGGLLRGRRNVVPGAIVFAILGGAGQTIYSFADARHSAYSNLSAKLETRSRWLDSKWSPVKVLSDDEYEGMLQEKLLRVKAEIALIDESIVELQKHAAQNKALETKPGEEK